MKTCFGKYKVGIRETKSSISSALGHTNFFVVPRIMTAAAAIATGVTLLVTQATCHLYKAVSEEKEDIGTPVAGVISRVLPPIGLDLL